MGLSSVLILLNCPMLLETYYLKDKAKNFCSFFISFYSCQCSQGRLESHKFHVWLKDRVDQPDMPLCENKPLCLANEISVFLVCGFCCYCSLVSLNLDEHTMATMTTLSTNSLPAFCLLLTLLPTASYQTTHIHSSIHCLWLLLLYGGGAEYVWPTKPKIFTTDSFKEKFLNLQASTILCP